MCQWFHLLQWRPQRNLKILGTTYSASSCSWWKAPIKEALIKGSEKLFIWWPSKISIKLMISVSHNICWFSWKLLRLNTDHVCWAGRRPGKYTDNDRITSPQVESGCLNCFTIQDCAVSDSVFIVIYGNNTIASLKPIRTPHTNI